MNGEELTDAEVVNIALARFRPLQDGQREASIDELMTSFGRSKNSITVAVRRAFRDRLVEIRKSDKPELRIGEQARHHGLEIALRQRFASLHGAIVVETRSTSSDRIHMELGYALACELGSHIVDNAVIGLGSGRGPYYTVMGLGMLPRLSHRNVTLLSLTGAVYPRMHDENVNALLDADFHAYLLGLSFSEVVTPKLMFNPIAHDDVAVVRSKTWLGDAAYRESKPTIAIVGVGVLQPGHRFFDAVVRGVQGDVLDPILAQLKKLVALSSDVRKQDGLAEYCPVADICNRLFFLPPPAPHQLAKGVQQKIEALITAVNARLLTASEEQMSSVERLVLVAGGTSKAQAIATLLDNAQLHVRIVCTDAVTARAMLGPSR